MVQLAVCVVMDMKIAACVMGLQTALYGLENCIWMD